MPDAALILRPATRDDLGFLQSLLPRFIGFGLPAGQDEGAVLAGAAQNLMAALAAPQSDSALLIAWVEEEGQHKRRAGFLRLDTERPLFGKPYAYLADLALDGWAEGHGLGQLLLAEAERWALEQGLGQMQLHVFATNARARKLYAQAGYTEVAISMSKALRRR